ncbi:FAD-dependent oxidoreductase [Amycolatopsis sp. CA-230715]|uniref:FAD-dependent oxidoreductase n=1 Tax=Amycolatopsis sp. CA-230715 TaxID=2745196 RepID=UPI0020B17C85|nr:FAD-dependent oxidoreductase [Amycolatopsis sp. CA-230715]
MADVLVIGGGVIGLTTAVKLRESGLAADIWTAERAERTTSAVAGATWYPYRASPVDRVLDWTRRSRDYFDAMAADPRTGVTIRESLQFWREPLTELPWWASAVPDVRLCTGSELPPGFASGYRFTQPVVTMPVYLRYLTERFQRAGGSITTRTISSFAEPAAVAPVVVNCTGLASRTLVHDPEVVPVRGQWVRVANPGVAQVIADFGHPDGEAYLIPHRDSCILGGTGEEGEWDTTPDGETAAKLVARCAELDPRVARAEVLEHRAGLRPVRNAGVRLAAESTVDGGLLVHDYGHGGAGVTLSWGCAEEVEAILRARISR